MKAINTFVKRIGRNLLNIPGRKIDRKVIVIESDDWGSIRIPSRKVLDRMMAMGMTSVENAFNKLDSLETEQDVEALFKVLRKFKDRNGNAPVFTANFIVGNPDFHLIESNGFENFFIKPFTQSYRESGESGDVFSLIRAGVESSLISPQYHGREHVNVRQWMSKLRQGHEGLRAAFNEGVYSLEFRGEDMRRSNLMATLDFGSTEDQQEILSNLSKGLIMFEEAFGVRPASFVAPCYVWDNSVEQKLAQGGVRFMQGTLLQFVPVIGRRDYEKRYLFSGTKSNFGQTYTIRNIFFEPATSKKFDWVRSCLSKIETAFYWNNAAILSSHRVNYMGTIDPENRNQNLELLNNLLGAILEKWPDVEFHSSVSLGKLYQSRTR